MKILQKIEFWFFSVPALVVAIGGIAHYDLWEKRNESLRQMGVKLVPMPE